MRFQLSNSSSCFGEEQNFDLLPQVSLEFSLVRDNVNNGDNDSNNNYNKKKAN